MRVRVKFSEDAMRQFGYVPQTTFEAAGATYKAEDIAAWHGAAITMLSEALKGGELDTVRRLQLGDQMEGHEQAQARWAEAAKGGDADAAVAASDAVLMTVGAGFTLAQALAEGGKPGWPGRPGALAFPPTYTAAAKAMLEG